MNNREFGTTEIKLSEICFGTWRYASSDGVPDNKSEAGGRALRRALDNGINCVHSSEEYGTRWLTGDVLRQDPRRNDVHHVIKVNEPDFGDSGFDRGRFRNKVERALKELHTERIAVVQHLQRGSAQKAGIYSGADDGTRIVEFDREIDQLQAEVSLLKQEGKIDSFAAFPYTVPFARHAVASGVYDGMVVYLNILETEWIALFPEMERRGMGVIGIRPLCAGLLTDKRIDRSRLPVDDRLSAPAWNSKYEQLERIKTEMPEPPESWTRYAIQMALAHPLVATTTLSINNDHQLDDALAAANGKHPTQAAFERIHSINTKFWETTR